MKILIADDHALFRDYLSKYILTLKPESIILQLSDLAQSFKLLQKEKIDMFIFDIDMLGSNGVSDIKKIQSLSPETKIVVLSLTEDIHQIKKLIETDITGYIPRSTDLDVLKSAFFQILQGNTYIPEFLKEAEPACKTGQKFLTNRQSQVLDLIAEGKSNKQIAYEMGVSEATVKLHINALLRSLKVSNRTEAVITAQKIGLI